MRKTYFAKKTDAIKNWYIVDAENIVLGRLATRLATVLRGKHKPMYTPNIDTGDNIVVINASKVKLTGKKLIQKVDFRHSGFPGGVTLTRYDVMMKNNPEKAIYLAVKGMLPKNKLRDVFLKKLHIYKDIEHAHISQKPEVLDIINMK
jgi:large subunit ribosomal protein L13